MTPQSLGHYAETRVGKILRARGKRVKQRSNYKSPYDLLIDGKIRIEVKSSTPAMGSFGPVWKFNFHRHNKLSESQVDFYVLRLQDVPYFKAAIHLMFRAPIKRKTISISLRSLLMDHASAVRLFEKF